MAGIARDASDLEVFYGDNVDFSGGFPPSATMIADGQLLIGSNSGHIHVGFLTPGSGITITNGPGSITIGSTGPSASMGPYIVGTELANFSTIQAAINAANATGFYSAFHPVDIVVKPKSNGTYYVENLTLFDGINIVALDAGCNTFGIFQDFENSVVIQGKISAPLTDQSLNKFVNVQIMTITDSFIDFPGVSLLQEIDFTGCQISIENTNPLFSNSGGGVGTNSFVCFDNSYIHDYSGSSVIYQDSGFDAGAILNLTFNNSLVSISGNTTVSQTTLIITSSNSSINFDYTGSSSALIQVDCTGDAKGFSKYGFTSNLTCVNVGTGTSLNFQNSVVNGNYTVNDIAANPDSIILSQCLLGNNGTQTIQFLGTCAPTLINCTMGCEYHFVQSTQTANYTTVVTDDVIPVDTTGGVVTITLYATPFIGMSQTVKDVSGTASTNNITINGNGKNIDGSATLVLSTNFASVEMVYNGTLWMTASEANISSGGVTVNTDSGSVTGSTITLHAQPQAGASISFSASGTTILLNMEDSKDNIFIGMSCGRTAVTGFSNLGIGDSCLSSITSGGSNCAHGVASLLQLTTGIQNSAYGNAALESLISGSDNLALGQSAGTAYTGGESFNLLLNHPGVNGESNVIRIGQSGSGSGQQNKCFIAGVNGVIASNALMVTINSSTDQFGVAAVPVSAVSWSVITADQTAVVNNGYICNKGSALLLALPATAAIGDIIEVTGINTALGFKITQAANQQIFFGIQSTTLGATGFLQSSAIRDSIRMVCVVSGSSTVYNVISSIGNITVN